MISFSFSTVHVFKSARADARRHPQKALTPVVHFGSRIRTDNSGQTSLMEVPSKLCLVSEFFTHEVHRIRVSKHGGGHHLWHCHGPLCTIFNSTRAGLNINSPTLIWGTFEACILPAVNPHFFRGQIFIEKIIKNSALGGVRTRDFPASSLRLYPQCYMGWWLFTRVLVSDMECCAYCKLRVWRCFVAFADVFLIRSFLQWFYDYPECPFINESSVGLPPTGSK